MADVKAYYHKVFRPDLTTIVVMGKIDPARAKAVIEKYFGDWKAEGPKPQTDLPAVPPNKAQTIAVPDSARVQDSVTLAETLRLTRSEPDYYALNLANAVLGGGFYSTRLSIDLRKNAGLVYTVGSDLDSGRTRSIYLVDYACDPQNVSKAAAIVIHDLKEMRDAPVTNVELTRAKALMLRSIPLGEASFGAIAGGFISRRDLGLPLDEPTIAAEHYMAVTSKEIPGCVPQVDQARGFRACQSGPGAEVRDRRRCRPEPRPRRSCG